uniref:Lysine-specific histone demethylase n=1 Tax=Panagrellus redivivus TaxID=6233 RepID=A0A7E4WDZ9_PANRE
MSTNSDSDSNFSERERPKRGRRKRGGNATNYSKIVEDVSIAEFNGLEIFSWEDDDLSLRSAAAQSRLPFDRLAAEELVHFPDVTKSKASMNLYLLLRNKCLQLWHLGPQVQLTVGAFKDQLKSPLNSDPGLITRVHAFLERYCYINYGIFHCTVHKTLSTYRRIIVIGAGYAGLMAAQQLKFFGFDVLLLEGRPRTGGRVMSYTSHKSSTNTRRAGDLGAMIVMGCVGNPIMTIAQQSPIRFVQINGAQAALYNHEGIKTSADKDNHIQSAFNLLLDTCAYISKELKINSVNGKNLSLGRAIDLVLGQMELRVQKRRAKFWSGMHDMALRQQRLLEDCYVLGKEIKRLVEVIEEAMRNKEESFFDMDINSVANVEELGRLVELRVHKHDLKVALEKFNHRLTEIDTHRAVYKEMVHIQPPQVYVNQEDRTILNFHKANMEYANGCPLHKVSLEHWDADDEWEIEGSHMMVRGGYYKVTEALTEPVKPILRRNHIVTNVEVNEKGVIVSGECPDTTVFYEQADAVLCTVPLGVLKWSIIKSTESDGRIKFQPPLPSWKCNAIDRMGFGSLNKAVFFFEEIFWDKDDHVFLRSAETEEARGECFQWFAVPDEPVLIALISGVAAGFPDLPNYHELTLRRMMNFLRTVYPNCPADPTDFVITKWHRDKFTRGCYSYIGCDATDKDHDVLAEPITDKNGIPRLFFGGEHTITRWPSTVHGAMISGFREATRIANTFGEPLYAFVDPDDEAAAKTARDAAVKVDEKPNGINGASSSKADVDVAESMILD